MGVPLDETELLAGGVNTSALTAGTFGLNMIHRQGSWQVRKGFGQTAQYNTSMSTNPDTGVTGAEPDGEWGYSRQVGSYLLRTEFDHMQLVTVLEANNAAYNRRRKGADFLGDGNWLISLYCVSIHDFTTGERWEEPIYRHTSEGDRFVVPLHKRFGQYLSCIDEGSDEWVSSGESQVWFADWDGRLLFGNDVMGVMLYSPSSFNGNTNKALDMTRESDWRTGVCESGAVVRCSPARGIFWGEGAGYAYISDGDFPAPVAAVTYGDRVVYASGKKLFFSDPFYPTNIMVINVVGVPSDTEIVALAVAAETLLIMTSTQTWYFRAPSGSVVSQGRGPAMLVDHVGCVGPSAVTSVGHAVVWCDTSGIYMSAGSTAEKISGDIDQFFTGFMTDPTTKWFPFQGKVGDTSGTTARPRRPITLSLKATLTRLSYSEELGALFVSVPEASLALCYSDSQWSVWSFQSNTKIEVGGYYGTRWDGSEQYIKNPEIVCREGRVVLVGSLDEQLLLDDSVYKGGSGGAVDDNTICRSYYILEYGRGGGIDRSVDNEDNRTVTGKYITKLATAGAMTDAPNYTDTPRDLYGGWMCVDPWIKVAEGYEFDGGVTANARTFLLPVSVVPPKQWGRMPTGSLTTFAGVSEIKFRFTFDSSHWKPVISGAAHQAYVEPIYPSERTATFYGYYLAISATASGTTHYRVEDAAGNADVDGNHINISWCVTGGTDTGYMHYPYMNLNARRKSILMYIPMMATTAGLTAELSGMALDVVDIGGDLMEDNCYIYYRDPAPGPHNALNIAPLSVALWEQWSLTAKRKEDSVAQPVDWAYKSAEIGAGTPERLLARGIAATVLSHGEGDEKLAPDFPVGLFNTLVAADGKMTMAQTVDYTGLASWTAYNPDYRPVSIQTNIYPQPGGHAVIPNPINTLRNRWMNSSGDLQTLTFGSVAGTNPKWGNADDLATPPVGDVLIGDEQVDTIVTSDGLKGTSFSYMMFGFIKNRAETIKLETVKALYRVRSAGRRRRGR